MEKNDDDNSDDEDHLEHTAGCGGGEVAAVTKPEDAVLPPAHRLRHNTQSWLIQILKGLTKLTVLINHEDRQL